MPEIRRAVTLALLAPLIAVGLTAAPAAADSAAPSPGGHPTPA